MQGTLIIIPPIVLHRLEKYWGPDADEFKPGSFVACLVAPYSRAHAQDSYCTPLSRVPIRGAERFLGGEAAAASAGGSKNPFAFLPFLAGGRACIGACIRMCVCVGVVAQCRRMSALMCSVTLAPFVGNRFALLEMKV